MINVGAKILITFKKLGQLLQASEEPESQGKKRPILQPMEKVLTEVRGPFRMYDNDIPKLQKRVEKFQGDNISSQIYNWKKNHERSSDLRYCSGWLKILNQR